MNIIEFSKNFAELAKDLSPEKRIETKEMLRRALLLLDEPSSAAVLPSADLLPPDLLPSYGATSHDMVSHNSSQGQAKNLERKAHIFNIQKFNMYDGPGVRTLVFFQGCPLRCIWCSNPESQKRGPQILYKAQDCVHCGQCVTVCPVGIHALSKENQHSVQRDKDCVGCGKCQSICPKQALSIVGESKNLSELLQILQEDKPFYITSGGGVTLGGGEVLAQPKAATNLLMLCKQEGIHTAIETCGHATLDAIKAVAEYVDVFLYDIKHIDSMTHYPLTGVHNERILSNLRWLLENKHTVRVRMPLLKGLNADTDTLLKTLEFLEPYKHLKNFKGIDILPYHKLGVHKYAQLDMEYPIFDDPSFSDTELEHICHWIGYTYVDKFSSKRHINKIGDEDENT